MKRIEFFLDRSGVKIGPKDMAGGVVVGIRYGTESRLGYGWHISFYADRELAHLSEHEWEELRRQIESVLEGFATRAPRAMDT